MENWKMATYSCLFDNDITQVIKQKAKEQNRTMRGQVMHYLKLAIQIESNTNEKADCTRQSQQPASETSKQFTQGVNV